MDFTTRLLLDPGYSYCWNLWYPFSLDDCAASEVEFRTSIQRVPAHSDYEPICYDDIDQQKFGYFRVERLTYDDRYGERLSNRVLLPQRHNIWSNTWQRDAEGNVIRDADGNQVRRLTTGKQSAGNSTLEWDGLDDNGARVEAGSYDMEIFAKDNEGSDVLYSSKIRALVEGIQFIDGTGYLVVGGTTVPLSSVVEIYAASNPQQSGTTRTPLTERFDNS